VSSPNFWRLQHLGIFDKINLVPVELVDAASLVEAIRVSEPNEIYHLAAQSFVGASFEQPIGTGEVTGLGTTRVLEAIRQINPAIKFYQASTSEMFGNTPEKDKRVLTEDSAFTPASPYAAAKLYGYWITKIYRAGYGMFCTNGILFNHESPIRGLEFVTRKISNAVAKIALGFEKKVVLGNLNSKRDWGFAPEYVESMWLMLQAKEPGDFVIATNESHSVREFVEAAFDVAGLDWQEHVETDKRFMRPIDVGFLQGDFSKAKNLLGWEPRTKFKDLVKIMVREDMSRWERFRKGEHFPWDAANYPSESNIITRSLSV
jgi:GDPmannose 4,6-dehydratase